MKKRVVGGILFCLVFLMFSTPYRAAVFHPTQYELLSDQPEQPIVVQSQRSATVGLQSSLVITYPVAGQLYLFRLRPMKLPNIFHLGLAVVVGRSLTIDTESVDVHHVRFEATQMATGWKTERWDYNTINGFSMDLGLSSGLYTIRVYGFDDQDQECARDLIKVLFVKIGRDDFGVWINTRYDNGMTLRTPLNLGIADFNSMLTTGETKRFLTSMQSKDDTAVELRFTRTKITQNSENVIETRFHLETSCDTSKNYEASLEVRFPFVLLSGGELDTKNNPFFSTQIGYRSTAVGDGINKVTTSFFVGREHLDDPRIFRLMIQPDSLETGSQVTFFTQYTTVDGEGHEVFSRCFSVEFDPATELTITAVPKQATISYEFGKSAGVSTRISFRAEGGILDDIIQRFVIDPLPSYMKFDLTILGSREFLYESDRPYDISYSLDSEQNGTLVCFAVSNLPQRIHAAWGLELGVLGDLSAQSFAELNMSSDVEELGLYFSGVYEPFMRITQVPKMIRCDSFIDVAGGTGYIHIVRDYDEPRTLDVGLRFGEVSVTKTFVLACAFVKLSWDIKILQGTGMITLERSPEASLLSTTTIQYKDWVFSKTLELSTTFVQIAWDVNRSDRRGHITMMRSTAVGGEPTVTFSVSHAGWTITNTLELKNNHTELVWDLPDAQNNHGVLSVITGGDQLVYTTLTVHDQGSLMLKFGLGIQTSDHLMISWDKVGNQIRNLQWSGRILSLDAVDISVHVDSDLLSIAATWNIGESGMLELQVNKNVAVTFVNTTTPGFKLQGSVSFFANRKVKFTWSLQETGYVTIHTFGQPVGDQFNLEAGFDPSQSGNYWYGFRLSGQNFIDITRTIQWHAQNGQLIRIWILGDTPLPGDWTLQILWKHQWYTVPWP
ncbi:MAG: hypothetical protein QXX20_03360 [Candidatus Thermoplasmatota archaeon]